MVGFSKIIDSNKILEVLKLIIRSHSLINSGKFASTIIFALESVSLIKSIALFIKSDWGWGFTINSLSG